jgi:dTDP-3-amino-3,4,6-trideoxy-alpha-D-glucose transaminase
VSRHHTIPFCDLGRALAPIRRDIDAAVARVTSSGWFLRGPETTAFEAEWAAYCGQAYCVTCNSGTDALTIAAIALNLSSATIPANTLALTGIGLHRGGARVRLSDVDGDGRMLAATAPDRVPVLLFGHLPEASAVPPSLVDAAHAHGWKPTTTAAFSFYPTKTLGALGDGGAVTTNDAALARHMQELCGRDDRLHDGRQITSRMDEVQAAVLRVKLHHLDRWLAERQDIAARYQARLAPRGLTRPLPALHHLFVFHHDERDDLAGRLALAGVETKVHWRAPLHQLPGPWTQDGPMDGAERWCARILSLPCYPGLTAGEVDYICDVIEAWDDGKGHHHAA